VWWSEGEGEGEGEGGGGGGAFVCHVYEIGGEYAEQLQQICA